MQIQFRPDFRQEDVVLRAEWCTSQQIGPPCEGPPDRLLAAPSLDPAMVPRQEHLGDPMATKLRRPSVLRKIKQPAGEGILLRRILCPEHPGNQAGDRIEHDKGSELTPAQGVVTDGELLVREMKPNPLIEALVPPTEQDEVILRHQPDGPRMIEANPLGTQENHLGPRAPERLHRLEERLRLEDHSAPPPVRDIIHHVMPVVGEGAEVVDTDREQPLFLRPPEDAGLERSLEDPGK